ncbi:hypothetical protein NQ318_023446 [Aromia moschata]|uniref:Uncharacterized protein n=1 Tax=Aromia moschata TaxID=1265417 RepID=A0AAV8YJN1_9CUCU|nr:hypothetical protein NQ318_023446 [Aromia moschata]
MKRRQVEHLLCDCSAVSPMRNSILGQRWPSMDFQVRELILGEFFFKRIRMGCGIGEKRLKTVYPFSSYGVKANLLITENDIKKIPFQTPKRVTSKRDSNNLSAKSELNSATNIKIFCQTKARRRDVTISDIVSNVMVMQLEIRVCKLSNETGNVAPDLATLKRELEGRFCFRLGHSATDTFAKPQHAYGDSVFFKSSAFRWFKAFSEGRDSIIHLKYVQITQCLIKTDGVCNCKSQNPSNLEMM